jgi:hypothetical protein
MGTQKLLEQLEVGSQKYTEKHDRLMKVCRDRIKHSYLYIHNMNLSPEPGDDRTSFLEMAANVQIAENILKDQEAATQCMTDMFEAYHDFPGGVDAVMKDEPRYLATQYDFKSKF